MRRTPQIAAGVAATALLAASFAPANALEPDEPEEVVGGLPGVVLSTAVAEDGTVYASQNFAGLLTRVPHGGEPEMIYADEGGREVGALSVAGDVVTFATTAQGGRPSADLYTYAPTDEGWEQTEVADLWAYERTRNPDRNKAYGIGRLSKTCKKAIPRRLRPFVIRYQGIKESHPYATAVSGTTTYVADAAGNSILSVRGSRIRTVAVLPAVKVKVTKKLRKNMGLPRCTQGKTFKGESVPTDVEVGADGNLYVTTLGGGLGESMPLGAIYKVTSTGRMVKQVDGLMMPVGLALGTEGERYVSLLGPSQVLEVTGRSSREVFAEVPMPGDVEVQGSHLYVTRSGLADPPEGPPTGAVLKYHLAVD